MTDTKHLPAVKQPGKSASVSPRAYRNVEPADPGQVVALLTACLALVRPVGMTEDEAEDWLHVAADSVKHLPIDILDAACLAARRTCTHHAQVVKAIIDDAQPRLDQRKRIAALPEPRPLLPGSSVPLNARRTQAEVDALVASPSPLMQQIVSLGLSCGEFVKGEDGRIVLAPEGASHAE